MVVINIDSDVKRALSCSTDMHVIFTDSDVKHTPSCRTDMDVINTDMSVLALTYNSQASRER